MPLPGRRVEVLPQSRVTLLPLLAVVIGIGVTELGLLSIGDPPASRSELDPATAWMLQSFITGQITIWILTAWGHSLCRFRCPQDKPAQLNLFLAAAAACVGWMTWMTLRISASMGEELVFLLIVFPLPILAITVPLLWRVILSVGRPRRSLWLSSGFLAFTLTVQCWGTPKVAADPANLLILNSALIAAAVVLWLIVLSLPPAAAPSRETR